MAGIRTPDHRVRVFISSTMGELADERTAARRAIEDLHLTPILFELGARPHPPRALYRAYLEQSDVFVGIYWERYGWIAPDEEISGLEDEYRLAVGQMPQLVYIKEPASRREPRLDELLGRIQTDDRLAYRRFSTAAELAALVADDLAVLLSERFQPEQPASEHRRTAAPPVPLDRTIGRERDVDSVVALVHSGHRLVSLTGVGGIGKTRLALEVARALTSDYRDAVVFVPLADVTEPSRVLTTLAERLGIRFGGVGDVVEEIVAELSRRPTLLVLDNFEHVAAAGAEVASVLARCPDVAALVTTRHVLRLAGEREYPVPPLTGDASSALFAERSIAVRPSFALTDENRGAVAEITRQLDGLPLAIELAAACMRLLSPAKLLDELSSRLDLLTRGATDAAERQRTLRATMDWSYDLLDEFERRLFARLAVFSGSWSLPAAEYVWGPSTDSSVLETLASLVEKSLVVSLDAPGEPRFRMLESVRAYAVERFEDAPDRAEIEHKHTQWMFELLIGPSRSITPPHHQAWLERFDPDRPNLRGAVERALRDHDAATVANLVRASIGYLSLRDAEAEAAAWLDAALRDPQDMSPLVKAQLLLARATLLGGLGRYDEASALYAAAQATGAVSHDAFDIALAAMAEAIVVSAKEQSREALDIAIAAAHAMEAIGSDVGPAYMWQTAGTIALTCDPDRADEYLGRGLALADSMENDGLRGQVRTLLGYSARRAGRLAEARQHFFAAAEAALRSGQRSSMAYALDGLAAIAVDEGSPEIAARALACSTCARSNLERTSWASFKPLIEQVAETARRDLGDADYAALAAEGSCLDVHFMLREAIDKLSATR